MRAYTVCSGFLELPNGITKETRLKKLYRITVKVIDYQISQYEGRPKSPRSLYFENEQEQKLCHYFFNITPLCLDALSPTLTIPVCLFLQNRSLLLSPPPPPPTPHQPPSTHKQHLWPSLLPKFLARRLVLWFAIRKKSEGATSRKWGWGFEERPRSCI